MENNSTLKCKTPIKIFAILSLVCILLGCINYFLTYDYDYHKYELVFRFPTHWLTILYFLSSLTIGILPVLYVFKFQEKNKAQVLLPIVFGTLAFSTLLELIETTIYQGGFLMENFLFQWGPPIVFSLATVSALKGFSKKRFPVIALCLGLVIEVFYIFIYFENIGEYIEDSMFLYLFTNPMWSVGYISLYITLLLFVLNNKITPVLKDLPKKEKKVKPMSPEQELKLLSDKLEQGMITEEEYQAQRANIISKL